MKYFVVFLICIMSFVAPSIGQSSTIYEEKIKIVVLGDSLTSGHGIEKENSFVTVLQNKILAKDYENISIIDGTLAGLTTEQAIYRINSVLELEPHIVILALGSNDAFAGVKLQAIYTRLVQIIQELKSRRIKILLMGVKLPSGALHEYQKEMGSMYEFIANQHKLELYPNILEGIVKNPHLTIGDRIHPNKAGTLTLVQNIFPHLEIVFIEQYRELIRRKKQEEIRRRAEENEF